MWDLPGLNPCSLRWQADSYPLHHQGSPQNADVNIPYDKLPRQVVDTREIKKSLWILILPQQEPAPPPALGPAELGTLPRPSPFCSFAMEAIYFLGLSRPILHPQSHSPLKTGVGVPRQQKPSLSTRTLTLFLCLVNLSFNQSADLL